MTYEDLYAIARQWERTGTAADSAVAEFVEDMLDSLREDGHSANSAVRALDADLDALVEAAQGVRAYLRTR